MTTPDQHAAANAAEGSTTMKETVLTCGRCGRENRGSHGQRVDNGIYLPGSWEEPGWVQINPAWVIPLAVRSDHGSVSYHIPVEGLDVCPDCLLDEERIPDERHQTITCGRCGRENRGRLDYDQDTEWEEPGWLKYNAATAERVDGADLIYAFEHTIGPRSGYVCAGCATAEERAQVDAIVWMQGEPA